jgi:hypothetical protein
MAGTVEVNGKKYPMPDQDDLTLGELEAVELLFDGDVPSPTSIRWLRALVVTAVRRGGGELSMEDARDLPMNAVNDAAMNGNGNGVGGAVPPPVRGNASQPSERVAPNRATRRARSGRPTT